MNKGVKVFVKVLYYIFTFALGILIAVTSPYHFYLDAHLDVIEEKLEAGDPSVAMAMVGGYFNKTPVYNGKISEQSGFVLFEATVLDSGNTGEQADSHLHKSYAGFLYGVRETYAVTAAEDNRTSMVITTDRGERTVALANYDSDGDGRADSVSTLRSHGFLLVDLDQPSFGTIRAIAFYDCNGNLMYRFAFDSPLQYDGAFFTDVDAFLTEYNRDFRSEALPAMNDAFLAKNADYTRSSVDVGQGGAVRKSVILVVAYFAVVYIVADLLLGKRYLIRFFKWILVKVFHVRFPEKETANTEGVFGHDYYSRVTVSLDGELPTEGADAVLTVVGSGGAPVEFPLTAAETYSAQKRLHAGRYRVLGLDLPEGYEADALPETLTAEGYTTAFVVNVKKKKI